MNTAKHLVILSVFAGIIDMVVAGICGMVAFIFCRNILKGSDALSVSLFIFVSTTVYYRLLFIPIIAIFKQKKLKLLGALSMTPPIFVVGFLCGVCSLTIVSLAYFFAAILTNYEYFVISQRRGNDTPYT